ncbi:PEP-CTERM sorting domain-containing protein [Argonema antarcticum]|uniref:PEP-CTERM sorting domain-containing protein n=1 Tax=Argonema antarcticum TaxID=2942763 RepID=UPI0020114746|nr:PEP-CTERM sorting domain-containing protein [Argonema antarcticum]MCL1474999.1 PEP-CTERM sorting domain-containing protein [Argonema antarcticum A004/B2]
MSAFTFTNKFYFLSLGISLVSAIALSLPQPAVSESVPFGEEQNLPSVQVNPPPPTSKQPVFDGIIPISELRQSIADRILQNTSQISALSISNLEIVSVRQVTWPNGCGGRPVTPDMMCTQAFVNNWIVTVKSGEQEWVYHTDGFRLLLEPDIIMPDLSEPNMWGFRNVPRGGNFDPPTAYGFRYKMVSDSLFTEIMEFPTGFAKPFGVLVKDVFLGEFQRGDRVPFSNYKALLGNLLTDGMGVEEFSVVGLNVDPTNPTAFPLRLDFNTDIASFNMYAILNEEPQSVPEPSSLFGILTFGTFGAGLLLKRQRQSVK